MFSYRQTLAWIVLAALLSPAGIASAHSGPRLDTDGCHYDRPRGDYHCHKGDLRGRVFRSRGEMQEARANDQLPEPTQTGFIERVFGPSPSNKDTPAPAPAAPVAPAASETASPAAPAVVPTAPAAQAPPGERTIEERLRVLKGLREMDLITQQEYDERRVEILKDL